MHNQPLVSITMPVFNGEKYVGETIESLLAQTYKNFELIIVNDASIDSSKKIIHSYTDSRIHYYENPVNLGIVKTRNKGLQYARGKYIAIMDNDDISMPTRLEKQVQFLESNADYGLCGSYYEVIDSDGKFNVRIKVPTKSSEINTFLLFNNCFCHSSVMVRREFLTDSNFVDGYDLMEDYELAYRLSGITKLANIPEYITRYRVHGKNQSIKKAGEMLSLRKKMDARILTDLKITFTETQLGLHTNFVNSNFIFFRNKSELKQLEKWLLNLYTNLKENKSYDSEVIARVFIKRWFLLFYTNKQLSSRILFSRLLLNFKSLYLKYMLEFLGDRFSKEFKVAWLPICTG